MYNRIEVRESNFNGIGVCDRTVKAYYIFIAPIPMNIRCLNILIFVRIVNPTRIKWTNFATFFFSRFMYQYSFPINGVPLVQFFSYEYATFFLGFFLFVI